MGMTIAMRIWAVATGHGGARIVNIKLLRVFLIIILLRVAVLIVALILTLIANVHVSMVTVLCKHLAG